MCVGKNVNDKLIFASLFEFYRMMGIDEVDFNEMCVDACGDEKNKICENYINPYVNIFDHDDEELVDEADGCCVYENSDSCVIAKSEKLENLKTRMSVFKSALREKAINMVFGDGDPFSSLMLVGEAPGADEDKSGIPFVGESGRLLISMFEQIGWKREALYITNVVPWRPENNRTPNENEVAEFADFLDEHIAIISPKALVAVGNVSAKALFKTSLGITKIHGKWNNCLNKRIGYIPVFPIFHPSYLLRAPSNKAAAIHDLITLKKDLEKMIG